MRNFILQVLRIPATTDKYLAKMYARIAWIFIWFAGYLLTLGPYATGHGFGWINAIPFFLWTISWVIVALHPRALATLVAIRLPGSPEKKKRETVIKTFSDTLPKVFGEIWFWPMVISFYLWVIDASLKPSLVWVIYGAGLIYACYTIRYQKDTRFFKKVSVTVAVIMIVVSLIRFMEPENQVHWFGFNISASLKASPWDKQMVAKEEKANELQQGYEHLEWQTLIEKARAGEITPAEYQVKLAELKEKKFARTVPGKIWGTVKAAFNGAKSLWPSRGIATATPPPSSAPAPAVYKEPVAPHWEIVTEKFVTYKLWNPEDLGYVHIAENISLPSGKYRLEFSGFHRQLFLTRDGREIWRNIPPEGLREEFVAYADKLPFPGTPDNHKIGARIMRINGSEPEYAGSCKEFFLDVAGPVNISVSVNIPQNWTDNLTRPVRDNFIHNGGGDKVVLKRLV